MASSIKGLAAYKKKDGTLSVSKDQRSLVWLPVAARDAAGSVHLAIANITSMSCLVFVCTMELIALRFAADPRIGLEGDVEDLRKVT